MKITLTNFSYPKLLFLGMMTTLLFVGNSMKIEAQTTININTNGTAGSYITGSVNTGGTKNDGDMVNISSTTNRGWATFDLSTIPSNALITGVTLNFTTTSASVTSFATNYVYGFNGDPATMTGTSLYAACGTGVTLDASTWNAGALNTKIFTSTGLSFLQANIGQAQVNLGFVRGSTNRYHIYGYGASASQQPQLSITYVLQSNCTGTPNPGTTVSSVASVCAGSTVDLSIQNNFTGQYGITYQWQTSSNGTTFTNSLNDTLPTLSITQNSTTYYQCIVGCGFTSNSATSNAIQVSLNGPTSCYCASTATFTGDEEIVGVQFGALNNISNCSSTAPGAGSTNQLYSNYTTLAPVNFTKGFTYNLDVTINTCGPFGSFYGEDIAVFIDYNQDGDYLDIGENVYTSPYAVGTAGAVRSSSIIIPCDALSGNTGMRVVYTEGGGSTSCGSYGAGETEDYLINIIGNPLAYVSSAAVQQIGVVAPGALDKPILRVPVNMVGCGVATANNFVFNTAGSSNVGDIVNAKLYRTDNSKTFSTTKLLANIANPNGSFTFSVNDTLLNNDTTNYWLAYDINAGAILANIVDARLDSIEILGAYRIPAISNPAGNIVINSPMTFVSANATQSLLNRVESGSVNNRILGMEVVTSAVGASINLTQFVLSANGTTDTSNIKNIKVWYTGNTNTFDTTTQFGSTLTSLPASATFSFFGTQGLSNGTNYFWLTYDVTSSASVGNLLDAEFISATVAGTPQNPALSAPSGTRQIRAPYCVSSATNTGDEEIFGVQFGALNNTSDCSTTAPGNGSVHLLYSNYTTLSPVSFTKGLAYNLGVTINTCGGFFGENVAVFIDYNQDGDFLDAGENIYTSPFATGSANLVLGGNITIPCNASLGETRMRVVYAENVGAASCGTYGYGETEDYLINIIDNPLAYIGSSATQLTAAIAPGASDISILRIPVKASGCGVGLVTEFAFNTIGTTNISNISSAKLYATGNSNTFSTGKLLSTILSPSGQFSFTGLNDTLLTSLSDTNNYWLAYDLATGATLGNLLDARIDSINILGQYRIPSNNNPVGARLIDAPMTYISSTITQTATTKVERSSTNNQIIGLQVVTSAIGSPIILSNIDVSTTGTSSLSDISNLKVWYTGNSNSFVANTQFGTTVSAPSATQSIAGITNLSNGTNYFWITYDINAAATIGNIVDAEISSLTLNGIAQTPSFIAPSGNRIIKSNYVSPTYSNGTQIGIYISNIQLGSINNTTAGSPAPYVTYYNNLSTNINCGSSNTLLVTPGTFAGNNIAAWIDFNNDGVYASTEKLGEFTNIGSAPSLATFNFFAPINASIGATRMRVISAFNVTNISPNGSFTYGETEDYVINILPAAAANVYNWNQMASGDFAVASNWTPSRTNPSLSDKLVFNNGGNITVTNLTNQIISSVTVSNNTNVTLSSVSNTVFGGFDSLNLISGKLIAGNNVIFSVGIDTNTTGVLTGIGSVEGILRRWVKSANNSISFPLSLGANSRSVSFTYTAAPSLSGMLTGQFVSTTPSSFGLPLTEGSIVLKRTAINGYWNFAASSGLTGGIYNVALTAQGFTGVQDYSTLVILKRLSTINQWTLEGTHVTTTGSNNAPVLNRTGLAGYGNFGVGGDTLFNTLPVTLVSLSAKNINGNAVISWTTSTEINNKGFEVERSFNGRTFSKINFVKGAVNSSVLHNYVVSDDNAFSINHASVIYYRLKQVDLNGKFTYSDIVSVNTDNLEAEDHIESYPNPFISDININITAKSESIVNVNIFDIRGQLVHKSSFLANQGEGIYKVENLDGLAGGIYFVRVESNGDTKTIKMTRLN